MTSLRLRLCLATTGSLLGAAVLLTACGAGGDRNAVAAAKAAIEKGDKNAALIELKSALQEDPQLAEARFLMGQVLLEMGDASGSVVELRKAEQAGFEPAQVRPLLAEALYKSAKYNEVVEEYSQAEVSDPDGQAKLKTMLALSNKALGHSVAAAALLEQALQAKPGFPPALLVKARFKAESRQFDEGIALASQVIAQQPNNTDALAVRAELLYLGEHDVDAALADYRQGLAKNPRFVAGHVEVISLLLGRGDLPGAQAQLEAMRKALPDHLMTKFAEAQIAYAQQRFEDARSLGQILLKAQPDDLRFLQFFGLVEMRLKAWLPAQAHLGRALKLAPQLKPARRLLARALMDSGQPVRAVEALKPLLEGAAVDADTLSLAGEAFLQSGDFERAESAFAQALKLKPDDERAQADLARSHLATGATAKGLGELELASKKGKEAQVSLVLLREQLRARQYDAALKTVAQLEARFPDKAFAPQVRGRVQMMRGDNAAARRSFEAALKLEPSFLPAAASLAALDNDAGHPDLARQRLEQLVAADPKNPQATLALADVLRRTGAPAEQVVKVLQDAVNLLPDEPQLRLALIDRLSERREFAQALEAARAAAAALPQHGPIQFALARAQMANGDHLQALVTLKKLAADEPQSANIAFLMAEAQARSNDPDAAMQTLARVLELDPAAAPAEQSLLQLAVETKHWTVANAVASSLRKASKTAAVGWRLEAQLQAQQNHWPEAVKAWQTALDKEPSSGAAVNLHTALLRAGQQAEADKFSASWLGQHGKDAAFLFHLGNLALQKQDFGVAEARFADLLKLKPDNAMALNNLAALKLKLKKPGALPLAEKAVKLMPANPSFQDTLAEALLDANQPQKALEMQRKVVAAEPGSDAFKLGLARIQLRMGDKASARAELERLAALGSKFADQAEVETLLKQAR